MVGISIADLTVCGAIPPYNEILGGKLIAMLAVSPEVIKLYRKKYADSQSIIASSVAGKPITRKSELAFIGTTSLYGERPSQYDRVSIPCSILGGKSEESIRYKFLEHTVGYGTFQFSNETSRLIDSFMKMHEKGKKVNYVFGEGANPRLRYMRDGLDYLGFYGEVLLQHGMPKCIYGVNLLDNLYEYLLGFEKRPTFLFDKKYLDGSASIITNYWFERWVLKRIEREDIDTIKARIAKNNFIYPIQHKAKVVLPLLNPRQVDFIGA